MPGVQPVRITGSKHPKPKVLQLRVDHNSCHNGLADACPSARRIDKHIGEVGERRSIRNHSGEANRCILVDRAEAEEPRAARSNTGRGISMTCHCSSIGLLTAATPRSSSASMNCGALSGADASNADRHAILETPPCGGDALAAAVVGGRAKLLIDPSVRADPRDLFDVARARTERQF
jgi:hypothetical protein